MFMLGVGVVVTKTTLYSCELTQLKCHGFWGRLVSAKKALVLLVLRLPRLGKRELILVLFVRLFDLFLFGFVGFLFLLVSGKGCGL